MIKYLKAMVFIGLFSIIFLSFGTGRSSAEEIRTEKAQNTMDVTIIHVDKYGIYAPNLIFYWDSEMSKQKMESLKRTAEKLRNKRATLTYLSTADLSKDKRPLVVDIIAAKEEHGVEPKETGGDKASEVEVEKPAQSVAQPGPVEDKEEFAPPAEKQHPREDSVASSFRREAQEEARPSGPVSKSELTDFVKQVMRLSEGKDADSLLRYYADEVDYYTRGSVNREYIRRDLGYYFRNWDTVSSALEGEIVVIVTDQPNLRIVKFISNFSVENSKKAVSGKTENIWKVQKIDRELRIIDQKQRILSSESKPRY